jgi:sec-independent protein translocase protein TatA
MNLLFVLLGTLGPSEIVLILIALLLLFGGKKIPELMKGLGTGIREFKKASSGEYDEKKEEEKKGQIENK